MTKEDTLLALKGLLRTKESAISLYGKNVADPLFLQDLDKEERNKVIEILLRMKADSLRHKKVLEELIIRVAEGTENAY